MQTAVYVQHQYQKGEKKSFQGTKRELSKEMKNGYYPVAGGKGSYQLSKPTSVSVVFQTETGEQITTEMKEKIKDLYGKDRITEKLVEGFAQDMQNGNVICRVDDNGSVEVKESR